MRNRSSLTAEYMAFFRALEMARPAETRLFDDPLAAIFLQGWRRSLYRTAGFTVARHWIERMLDSRAPGARAAGIARTYWIDQEATAVLGAATQLVLLGAGFDTRAFRLPAETTFELDHPETSRAKQAALKRATGSLPKHIRFAGIDFNRQSIGDVLSQAGFDSSLPACFIWEGVTNYLSPEAVDSALRQIHQSAPSSVLIFTYVDRRVLEKPDDFFGGEKLISRLNAYGEPWTFGLRPKELADYLATRGLRLLKDIGVADVWRSTGRPATEIRGYEFYRLASARANG